MKKYVILILLACILIFSGCRLSNVRTRARDPKSGEFLIDLESKSDALVEYEDLIKKIKWKVDNKGGPSVWEMIFGIIVTKPDIQITP